MKKLIAITALLGLVLPLGSRAVAQDFAELLLTSGTTISDGTNEWAYILFQGTEPLLLKDQQISVYQKDGAPSSTNTYELVSTAKAQTSLDVLNLVLMRAAHVGEDLVSLENDIDELFGFLNLDAGLSLAEKLSEIIQGSQSDVYVYDNLLFLGKKHPAVAMASGQAFAGKIAPSGKTTFELRSRNQDSGAAGGVIGRVTVEAGNPTELPAPSNLIRVPDDSPKGHLNIRLHWQTTEELRRQSLLSFGYGIYRMSKGYAQSNGYHTVPPSIGSLTNALQADTNDVKACHTLPVLIDEDETTTNDFFFIDDNDRFKESGEAFSDGDEFYYFVGALDILGRPGNLSTGLLVLICDTLPPAPPVGLDVRNVRVFTNGTPGQHLEVTWDQVNTTNETTNIAYYVYRWLTLTNLNAQRGDPTANQLAGPIDHVEGAAQNSYTDDSVSSNQQGVTWWYTIQAAEITACGTNWSGHSAPHFGVFRDWNGPEPNDSATMTIMCCSPIISSKQDFMDTRTDLAYNFHGAVYQGHEDIEWAEMWWTPGSYSGMGGFGGATYLGKSYYAGSTALIFQVSHTGFQDAVTFYARAGSADGKETIIESLSAEKPTTNDKVRVVPFEANVDCSVQPVGPDCDTWVHLPTGGVVVLDFDRPEIGWSSSTDSREYKLYRKLGFNDLTMIAQGTNLPGQAVIERDLTAVSLNCADVCYYFREFDEHGNQGPLNLVTCFQATGWIPLDKPVLHTADAAGTPASPKMTLGWYQAPYGVERFYLYIGTEEGDLPVDWGTEDFSTNLYGSSQPIYSFADDGSIRVPIGKYISGRVGTTFGNPNDPNFEVTLSGIELGKKYYMQVVAVNACGETSESEPLAFTWSQVSGDGIEVPWPDRPLPDVTATFNDEVYADFLVTSNYNVSYALDIGAVRIGELVLDEGLGQTISRGPTVVVYPDDPTNALFRSETDDTIVFPCALYRYQVANTKLPRVSGDVVQVSPMMENIAHDHTGPNLNVYDPFIHVLHPANEEASAYRDIWLSDTQPVIRGASYQYLLVQFDRYGEIKRTIKLNTVTIPEE